MLRPLAAASVVMAAGALAAIADDVPQSPFDRPDVEWQLAELGGSPFDAASTIIFPEQGRVAGLALCNRFMGSADWTPETLSFGPLGMTMMACADMEGERTVVDALAAVVAGGILGDELILTLADGGRMVYRAP